MSFQGAVRARLTVAAIAALGVIALSPYFNGQVYAQDSDSSLVQKPESVETTNSTRPSEPIPNPTLRESSSESRDADAKSARAGITAETKSAIKSPARAATGVNAAAKKPVDRKVPRGKNPAIKLAKRGNYPSRGYFSGRRIIDMRATAYTADPAENGGNRSGRTAIGLKIGHGVVAVDPRVIPLGTRLFIEGYGHAVAADTGGAIKGHKIDLGCDTKRQMRKIGRRRVKVHILD
jgi:3D (Asp-Asp-Asp) domain-containing protein